MVGVKLKLIWMTKSIMVVTLHNPTKWSQMATTKTEYTP